MKKRYIVFFAKCWVVTDTTLNIVVDRFPTEDATRKRAAQLNEKWERRQARDNYPAGEPVI